MITSNSQMYDNNIDTYQKKRGRPRKNNMEQKPQKQKNNNNNEQKEEDIILCLPISINNETDKHEPPDNTEKYNSDSDYDCSDSDNDYNNIINKLKNEINGYKKIINELMPNHSKEQKTKKINIKLVDYKNGETIINDHKNIACWWCTYEFDTQPCFIPDKICDNVYYVFGCFCSYNCALAYNINMNDYKIITRCGLIFKLCDQLCCCKPKIAPPKEILIKFGGYMSIEEYRSGLKLCDKNYRIIYPPMTSIVPIIEETNRYINNFSVNTDDNLKIKRTKPLPGTTYNLMDTLKNSN